MTASQFGAYGFRLKVVDQSDPLPNLLPLDHDSEVVTVRFGRGRAAEDTMDIGSDLVSTSRSGAGSMRVTRVPPEIYLEMPDALTPDALVHPMVTTPLSVLARWRGMVPLHAGAVVVDGAAFAVCGDREAGKSSMLAELTSDGTQLVTDDLLVLDGGTVLSGPHCLDLRTLAAERYGAVSMGIVGDRERFRVVREPAPPRVPLGGLFALSWADVDEPEVQPLTLADRLKLLHDSDYVNIQGQYRPEPLLDLLAFPMWRILRRQAWDQAAPAAELLRRVARTSLRGEPSKL